MGIGKKGIMEISTYFGIIGWGGWRRWYGRIVVVILISIRVGASRGGCSGRWFGFSIS